MKKNKLDRELFIRSLKKISLIMHIIIILLFMGILQLQAVEVYSQKTRLTLTCTDTELIKVLDTIEEESEFYFLYNEKLLDTGRKVNIIANNQPIVNILGELFIGTDIDYTIVDRKIILAPSYLSGKKVSSANAQQIMVSGTVKDSNGEPLIGVTVLITGTTVGTLTDVNGSYQINVPSPQSELSFSYVGYTTETVVVSEQARIDIVLEENILELDDIVVIGYGTMPKRSVSTAISSIEADNIKEMPVSTIGEALYGRLPGLYIVQSSGQPGSSPTMRIRGTGSLTASSDPLYVIDGFPTTDANFFMNLSADDIESINILKDAASAAIYGSRAGNGVILVTTRKGRQSAPEISFNSTFGFQQPQRYIDVLSASEFALMVKDARANQGMAPLPILDDPDQWVVTDWQKDVYFRTAGIQQYDIAVRGSGEKVRYSLSANYQHQNGIVQNSFNHRLGVRAAVESDFSKYVTAGINIQPTYTYQRVQTTSGGNTSVTAGTIAEAVAYPPIYGPYAPNGDYFQIQQHTTGTDFNSELTNPLSKLLEINNDYNTIRTLSQAFVSIKPIKGLVVKSEINATAVNQKNEYYRTANSPGSSRKGNKSTPNLAAIDAYRGASFDYNYYWSSTANYLVSFADAHSINALLGYDVSYFNAYNVRQDDRTDSNYPIAYGNTNIENVNGAYIWNGTSSNTEYVFDALFGRLNYDYKSKYLLSASIRQDRSSKFGPKNRAGIFWSLSGAYNFSEETWMKNINWLSIAKLRASYGVTGNDQIGSNYVWTSTLSQDYYIFGSDTDAARVTGYYPGGYSNLGLGWERNTQLNLGMDLGFFNRVSFTVDYYNRISDAVLSASIPNLNGKSSSVTMNAGEIRNRGLEFSIAAPILTREFKWTANFNISFNRNKLLSLATGNDYYGSVNGMVRNYVGRPLGDIYCYVNIGTFNSLDEVANDAKLYTQSLGDLKFLDYKKDGVINSDDMVYQGNNMPKFNAGFTSQFSYKNFDLSVVLDAQYGGLIYWGFGYASGLNRHMENAFGIYSRNRWRSTTETGDGISQKAGSSNVYGALVSQTRYLFKSDYLKVRNVTLSYKVPAKISEKVGIKNLGLNISGQNLISFDEYPGYSIEASGMGGATGGSDGGNYPTVRTITFGVNINF
jgi:TonB-linked SusC/RagA family outer membrane protein